jgi:asparagine synthase (glutamine-hydrolysing)
MCGIAGILAQTPSDWLATAERMAVSMKHRGPDDVGVQPVPTAHLGTELWLVNRRLAIQDLSTAGHQPMSDGCGNWVAYNGEVFNFREIRAGFEREGQTFASDCDTEVILAAYSRWGASCVDRFRGMFAIALWDARRQELWLARDRLGLKPLYVWRGQDALIFASEVRTLLASGMVPRRLSQEGLSQYLTHGFSVAPTTLVQGVRSLLPGTWLRLNSEGDLLESRQYWQITVCPDRAIDHRAAVDLLRERFREAVQLRLIADVPTGAFLSGGLDSAAIVSQMAAEQADVRTLSIAFDEPGYDESRYARLVASHFGTKHTESRLTTEIFRAWLPDALRGIDQPTFDGMNTYYVARSAREAGLTVALSGLGSDELFGGYPFFRQLNVIAGARRLLGRASSPLLGVARTSGLAPDDSQTGLVKLLTILNRSASRLEDYVLANSIFLPTAHGYPGTQLPGNLVPFEMADLLKREISGLEESGDITTVFALRLFLGERCLRDTDAMSMATSVEVRAPFTDHLLVEAALRVPASVRTAGTPNKQLVWSAFGDRLPEELRGRRKQGFTFPFAVWLRKESTAVTERLRDSTLARRCGLRTEEVSRLRERFLRGTLAPGMWSRVWALGILLDWCDRHGVYLD